MSVRAKFKCTSITHGEDSSSVVLSPVTNGSEENKTFYKWTPGGSIGLNILSKETAENFEPGKEYYVDFTLAE